MTHDDEVRQLETARRALVAEFDGRVPAEEVDRRFSDLVAQFAGAPVRSFVPVLVQQRARQALRSPSA